MNGEEAAKAVLESTWNQTVEGVLMQDDVAAYIDAIDAEHRPLFDRVHRLVMEVHPEARVVLPTRCRPTWQATASCTLASRKHGLSFYGWGHGSDGGLVARHPHLDNGKGTLRLPLTEAVHISDDELRAFLAAALTD